MNGIENAWRRFDQALGTTVVSHFVGILTLFPNKLHIGDYLEDKIFYCPIGINLLIGIEPG